MLLGITYRVLYTTSVVKIFEQPQRYYKLVDGVL